MLSILLHLSTLLNEFFYHLNIQPKTLHSIYKEHHLPILILFINFVIQTIVEDNDNIYYKDHVVHF